MKPLDTELPRRRRVVDMMLTAHSTLRDKYSWWATALDWTAAPPSVTATVPTPTATTAPTLAVVVTAPRATPATFVLQVYRRGQESLVVVNRSLNALPLASLQIGDGNGAIMGTEWNLATLQAGACVAAFQARGNPKLPDVQCDPVGARVTRSGAARFWGQDFAVYYAGKRARTCKKDDTEDGCFVPIVVR